MSGPGRLLAGARLSFPTSPVLLSQAVRVAVFREQQLLSRSLLVWSLQMSKSVGPEAVGTHPRSKARGGWFVAIVESIAFNSGKGFCAEIWETRVEILFLPLSDSRQGTLN